MREELRQQRVDLEHMLNESVRKSDQQGRGVADAASSVTREVKWLKSASLSWFWAFIGVAFGLGALLIFVIDRLPR